MQGLLMKAEAYYQMMQFEYALMYYHRGNKIRPEVPSFRLGIQKSQEAIENSIGGKTTAVDDFVFRNTPSFSYLRHLYLFVCLLTGLLTNY